MVTVFSTQNCMQCRLTYRALDERGIDYTIVDLSENEAAAEYVTDDLGYSQAPAVVIDDNYHWSGLRIDLINQLAG